MEGRLGHSPTSENLLRYQFAKIRETAAYIKNYSPYYRRILYNLHPEDLRSASDLAEWPLTTQEDLKLYGAGMVCVSQDEICRVVSLTSSGTTGGRKRVWFTDEDQERTRDFFHHGMMSFTSKGDIVLIGMPGPQPGSIGPLLYDALSRFSARGIVAGPLGSLSEAGGIVINKGVTHFAGLPRQAAGLSAFLESCGRSHNLKTWLLTADYVPSGIRERLEAVPGTAVYEHWGMTETGLGGGVFCGAKSGYHMREADLYIEIIDPDTGVMLSPGQWGEIVITTLSRLGMPLFRYRTGDCGRWLSASCSCGSMLRLMDRTPGRLDDFMEQPDGSRLARSDWEDAVFSLDGVIDYRIKSGGSVAELIILNAPAPQGVEIEKLETILQGRIEYRNVRDWSFEGPQKGIWGRARFD